MKKMGDIVPKELFINAFEICKSYTESDYLLDINLMLLKNSFHSITESNIENYYNKFIQSEIFYSIPYLFANDIVTIPKNINGLREYRFFSTVSMILYNAIGLLFVNICSEFVKDLNFKADNIFQYSPTKFNRKNRDDSKWEAKNEYSGEYKRFTDKMDEIIEVGDVVLKVDISSYFETISHDLLIKLIRKFGLESKLASYDIDEKSENSLQFYFESMMNSKYGIPQGKANCVSDIYGYMYLIPFDMEIRNLCSESELEYKAMIRYVDDIILVLKRKDIKITNRKIFKELSSIEQRISSFLYNELGLKLNNKKTQYEILDNKDSRDIFVVDNTKKVSNKNSKEDNEIKIIEIQEKYDKFIEVLRKYKFLDAQSFNLDISKNERESLKVIFDKPMKNFLKKPDIAKELRIILKDIDIELTTDEMNILIALFFVEGSYINIILDYIYTNKKIKDKRMIHIILLSITQKYCFEKEKRFNRLLKSNMKELLCDNYGRYILVLEKLYNYNEEMKLADKNSIFNHIAWEYGKKVSNYTRNFLEPNNTLYNEFISKLLNSRKLDESIVMQLKLYIYNFRKENWDIAFNHFQNTFHELCKDKYKLKDIDTIREILNKLYKGKIIDANKEIILRKFYDRRNFNPISHPSKNNKASIKVSEDVLNQYEDNILRIMIDILES